MIGYVLSGLIDLLTSLPSFLIAITVHEYAHAYFARLFGDETSAEAGELSVNPLIHIDISGFLALIIFKTGWAKFVLLDKRNFKFKTFASVLIPLSGCIANFLTTAFFIIIIKLYNPVPESYFYNLLMTGIQINIAFGLINLLPIPPLSGAKIIELLLWENIYRYEFLGVILLYLLLFSQLGFYFNELVFLIMRMIM